MDVLCQECKAKTAVIHVTNIINNKKAEIHLCEECAQERDEFKIFVPLSITDLLAGFLDLEKNSSASEKKEVRRCATCGIDYAVFKKTGRLGCGECYRSFKELLIPLIKRVQGNARHSGKTPKQAGGELRIQRRVEQLKNRLRRAIELEAYEEAAGLRDQIHSAEQ